MIKLTNIIKTIIAEEIDPSEAYNDIDAVQTLIDGKRNLAFVVEKSNNKDNWARIQKMIADNGLKAMYVKGNSNNPYIVYTPGSEAKANELKDIAETYDGYLSANATKEDTIKIGELLGYNYDKIMAYVNKNFPKTEARVTPVGIMGRILPKEDVQILADLTTDNFAEGNSDFDLYEPLNQQYDTDDYCDEDNYDQGEDSECASIQKLFKKYPNGAKFVSNDIFTYDTFAPGVLLNNKFTELIEIDPKHGIINVSAPYINSDGYNAGWFDQSGKYYPDTKNLDEDGNYIGG